MDFAITHISTACTILEIGDTRILTDPVFDPPGRYTLDEMGLTSARKDHGPAIAVGDIGPIDIMLLSHHDHQDNFDKNARRLVQGDQRPKHIVSTRAAKKSIPEVTHALSSSDPACSSTTIGDITITATPALHVPPPFSWFESSDHVNGWILEWPGQKHGALYITGDTVQFGGIKDVIKKYRGNISVIMPHMGEVRFWLDLFLGRYTFNAKQAAKVCSDIEARTVIPLHYEGWTHFKQQNRSQYDAAFEKMRILSRVNWLKYGERTEVEI
jgi:L-ascorbate metabolism protein UlaG (beta-lactamase superfamily)